MIGFGKLNQQGINLFKVYVQNLKNGVTDEPPIDLCLDRETSEDLDFELDLEDRDFEDRVELGKYLVQLIAENSHKILYDVGFWNALTLIWFDKICPVDKTGKRQMQELSRYIFDGSQFKSDRHLLWGPWWAMNYHKDYGNYLLYPPIGSKSIPLLYYGEIMNRFGGNSLVSSIPAVIKLGKKLYEDPDTSRPKKGVSGKGRGTPIRFVSFLKQLEMTYDFSKMPTDSLYEMLPAEFDKWK